jgi:hypothetical protein
MTEMELLDEPIKVVVAHEGSGQITPQRLVWREREYTMISVGRQWDEPAGHYVLVEAAGDTRFELQLRREDLTWRIRRVWWGQTFV